MRVSRWNNGSIQQDQPSKCLRAGGMSGTRTYEKIDDSFFSVEPLASSSRCTAREKRRQKHGSRATVILGWLLGRTVSCLSVTGVGLKSK